MSASINHLEERLRDPHEPLSRILPAAITIASMARQRQTSAWLRAELEGYPLDRPLPDCRQGLSGHIVARSPQYGWIPAPVSERQNRDYGQVNVAEGIGDIEQFCLNCKKGSGKQVALPGDTMQLLQSNINLKAELAITVGRDKYCHLVRVTRGAIYLWTTGLIELGLGGERNSFREPERQLAATLDTPELYLRQALEMIQHLPVPEVREAGFFERMFGRAS